jgi:hypothetical protein
VSRADLHCPCPRCHGWVEPTWLVAIERRQVLAIEALHCLNCGWYGGEPLLDQRAVQVDDQLALVGTTP